MPHDLKYACRSLLRSPGVTAVAIATLGIGVGLNTSLFSCINVMLFKPLAVERADELIWISSASTKPDGPRGNMTYPDVVDLGASTVLSGATAYAYLPANLATNERAERLHGQLVMGNFFDVLAIRPHRGRLIAPDDDQPQGEPIVVIGHGLWQRMFLGRDDAVGSTIRVNGTAFTIAGVAPRGFHGADVLEHAELWVPIAAATRVSPDIGGPKGRNSWWLKSIGRLARGRDITEAAASLRAQASALAQAFPDSHDGFTIRVDPLRGAGPDTRGEIEPLSAMLLAVTMIVLFIACANVANLLLVRGIAAARETAIRAALGASRGRLLRQQLIESALLAIAGGAVGLLLSLWTTELLLQFAGLKANIDLTPDRRVLLFTAGLSAITVLLFGLAPAVRASHAVPAPALKTLSAAGDGRRSRLQRALVAAQIALSMVLLLAAGVFLKSLVNARHVDVGFDPKNRVALSFNLRMHGYSHERADAFHRALIERVRSRPEVRSAALAGMVPLGGRVWVGGLAFPDRPADPDVRAPRAALNFVWPGFFETMGIPILRGRSLTESDMLGAPASAVVNQTMARLHWPDRDPIGQRFGTDGPRGPFVEVVGVARDTVVDELNEAPIALAYLPGRPVDGEVALLAWVKTAPANALRQLESDVRALDGDIAVFAPKTLEQHIADRMDGERGLSRLLSVTGAIALALAAIGLYGVMANTVVRRTREIGVRVALGANPRDVVRLVLADAARLGLVGLASGVPPAVGVTALLASSLLGVEVGDPLTMGLVAIVLAAVVLLSAYLPARRAVRVDPVVALRAE